MDTQILAIAFSVWAAVVAIIGGAIAIQLAALRADVKAMGSTLASHQLEHEGRVTAIETHLQQTSSFQANHHRRRKND